VARSIFYYTDSDVLGGAEEALLMLIENLDRAVWRPTLLLGGVAAPTALAERATALEVSVRTVPATPLGLTGASRVPGLARWLARERPDVFHAQLPWLLAAKWPLTAAVLARVPAVVATVQLIMDEEVDRASIAQLRLLARGIGRYIAVSRDIAGQLRSRLRLSEDRVEVIYNAVDSARFAAVDGRSLRAQLTAGEDRPVILTCARLDAQKGHPVLLEAAAELPEAVFALAGAGPERAALERRAAELGVADQVLFLGRRDDVPELLAACDVFALPSRYEGSSLALLEAMAAARAIVSSAIPGTDELVSDGLTGVLVPPGDASVLAQALRRLLSEPDLRAALGNRARERSRDFSPGAMAAQVTRVYGELLGRR
jgi:glycosyltransferase involved in cell wall biosynthesis